MERNPRHLRPITPDEKISLSSTHMKSRHGDNTETAHQDSTWWQRIDGASRQHLHRARSGDTLKDVTQDSFFRFECEIASGHANGRLFKGYYLDAPRVCVERNPRHLRPLTPEEKLSLPSTQVALKLSKKHGCSTTPRVGECVGCVRRTSVNPSLRQATATPVLNDGVSRCEPAKISQHYFGNSNPTVQQFALRTHNTLVHLKRVAKSLCLRVTTAGRGIIARTLPISPRIAFGLKRRAVASLKSRNIQVKSNLFKFGFHVKTGFYEPSEYSNSYARHPRLQHYKHHARHPHYYAILTTHVIHDSSTTNTTHVIRTTTPSSPRTSSTTHSSTTNTTHVIRTTTPSAPHTCSTTT